MRVIVVGLGSMGRRRIRLIRQYSEEIEIYGIDKNESRRIQTEEEFRIRTFSDLSVACQDEKPKAAFISTPPHTHASIIMDCLKLGMHVFTEINLSNAGYRENLKRASDNNVTLFLSSTFLYRDEVCWIRERVSEQIRPCSYTYHTGQYLPDWHPWEDYRNFFAGRKETNGCREIMAIEFPWLADAFGDISAVKVLKGRHTGLDIDFDDVYHLLIEHENGNLGMVAVDVVSRKAVRNLEVYGEQLYVSWNGRPDGLIRYDFENKEDCYVQLYDRIDRREGYSSSIIENAYYEEILNFFEVIQGNGQPRYSFEKDEKILAIIDQIEKGNDYDKQ